MPVSLAELAVRFGCELRGDPARQVDHVAPLAAAGPSAISFLSNRRYLRYLGSTGAAAVVLSAADADACPTAALVADNPYVVYARIAALLHPPRGAATGIHQAAVVGREAVIADGVSIGALAYVADGARLDAGVAVGPGCVVDSGAVIGADTQLKARSCVAHDVVIGQRCVLHEGAIVGADGFGIARSEDGWVKVPQVGSVRIGDDVEVGANTTIDRGAIDDTVIGDDVRLDNLIQVGHNVVIGAHTAIAAGTAIAGSARIGENCLVAGHVGIVGHIQICDNVTINAKALVTRSIDEPGVYSGKFPAQEARQWGKTVGRIRQLVRGSRNGPGDAG